MTRSRVAREAGIGFSRREALVGAGALIVSFSMLPAALAQQPGGQQSETPEMGGSKLPGSLAVEPHLDAWIKVEPDGAVTVFTGKAELGQGIKTAFLQIAAEELDLPLERLTIVTADTQLTANEGYTAGSHSIQDSGTAIRNAAAQVRDILIGVAAQRWGLPAEALRAEQGAVIAQDGRKLSYGALVSDKLLHVAAQPTSRLKDPASFKVMNTPVQRVDIPAKVTGGEAFLQDMRLPGMLHARIVRPPSYGATLQQADLDAIRKMPGFVNVVRDGNFLAVVFAKEFQAVQAMRALAASAQWDEKRALPDQAKTAEVIRGLPSRDYTILDKTSALSVGQASIAADYSRPFQSHGSIGPSCAIAQLDPNGMLTVWTHTQGVYPDRKAIAEMVGLPAEKVRCIHVQGSGCYGHNAADDAGADAALLATKVPGRPIRVQLMREQEHAWEPFGPAMVTRATASLNNDGSVASFTFDVWSNTHNMRPGSAGALLAAQHIATPFPVPEPKPIPQPEGGGDRNAIPLYDFPTARVVHHFLPDMPIRISAMRSLGAYMNIFSLESFMDEAALAARMDPVEFRLRHLKDERARAVVSAAADAFGWKDRPHTANGTGSGFAFARYKNLAAYCAVAMEVEVDRDSGRVRLRRVIAAIDTGQVVNPDGVRNQIEGAILQSASWTLYESISFDRTRITSVDWSTYPILRFQSVPDSIEVHIIDRPGLPFLGAGEAGQGPAAAAIANAIADATGQRLRDLPLTAERIKDAINT